MSYLKYRADVLFTGIEWLSHDHVLVVQPDGTVEAIVAAEEAGEDIITLKGILSPGWVNCHCHLELSHLKGKIPEHTGLIPFLLAVVKQRAAEESVMLQAIENAENEMLAGGIVAVGDICNTAVTVAQKNSRRMYYHNFIEAIGVVPSTASQRFAEVLKVYEHFAPFYSIPIQSVTLVPHAPYSVAPELLKQLANFPGNQLLTMHHQETPEERQWMKEGKGPFTSFFETIGIPLAYCQSPMENSLNSVLKHFYPHQQWILVHNVDTQEEDLQLLPAGSQPPFLCLCPNANLYISNRLPDIPTLMNTHCPIVLGTDSLASNHRLSILDEMNTIKKQYPQIDWRTLLTWATLNGAKALQMDAVLGSFEKGKTPGILLISNEYDRVQRVL